MLVRKYSGCLNSNYNRSKPLLEKIAIIILCLFKKKKRRKMNIFLNRNNSSNSRVKLRHNKIYNKVWGVLRKIIKILVKPSHLCLNPKVE